MSPKAGKTGQGQRSHHAIQDLKIEAFRSDGWASDCSGRPHPSGCRNGCSSGRFQATHAGMTGKRSLGSVQSTRNPSLFQLYNQGLRSKMIADAEGDMDHVVCGVETKQVEIAAWRSFREIEPDVVVFPFGEHGDMSGDIITESDLRVESKFRAGL